MTRYQAPKHVSGIHCPSGNEYRADHKGVVHVKGEAPAADHIALLGAGFTEIADEAPAPKAASKPAK